MLGLEVVPVMFLQHFCKSEITLNMQFKNLVYCGICLLLSAGSFALKEGEGL